MEKSITKHIFTFTRRDTHSLSVNKFYKSLKGYIWIKPITVYNLINLKIAHIFIWYQTKDSFVILQLKITL